MNNSMTYEEKIALLQRIDAEEKRLFYNYSNELELLIHDDCEEIRNKAIIHLWNYPTKHFYCILKEIANSDINLTTRLQAIICLGRYVYEYANNAFTIDLKIDLFSEELDENDFKSIIPFLLEIYFNHGRTIKEHCAALESLSYYKSQKIIDLINDAFNNGNPELKQSAIYAMGHNKAEQWKPILLNEINKTNNPMLIAVVKASGEYKLNEAGSHLQKLAQSSNHELIKAAIFALSEIKFKEAYNTIENLCDSDNQEIQKFAIDALEIWHSESIQNDL